MRARYLVHKLNHTILLVDITPIGLPTEIYPPEGKQQKVTSIRFQSWLLAEQFLAKAGASSKLLDELRNTLKASGVAVLTVPANKN